MSLVFSFLIVCCCWLFLVKLGFSVLCLKQLGKFVGYFAHQLLIGCTAFGFLAEDARKDFHQIMLAMLMLLIVGVPQYTTTQL